MGVNLRFGIDIIITRLLNFSGEKGGPFSVRLVFSSSAAGVLIHDMEGKFKKLKDSMMCSIIVVYQVGEEHPVCISSTLKSSLVSATQRLFEDLYASCPALVSLRSDG